MGCFFSFRNSAVILNLTSWSFRPVQWINYFCKMSNVSLIKEEGSILHFLSLWSSLKAFRLQPNRKCWDPGIQLGLHMGHVTSSVKWSWGHQTFRMGCYKRCSLGNLHSLYWTHAASILKTQRKILYMTKKCQNSQ